MTAAICGEGDEDIVGGEGEGGSVEVGGVNVEELGYVSVRSLPSSRERKAGPARRESRPSIHIAA